MNAILDKKLKKAIIKANKSVWQKSKANKITKKGLYEVWYTIVDDVKREEAYWIRYTLLCPKTKKKHNKEQDLNDYIDNLGGDGMLWLGYFNNKDPSKNEMVKTSFPLSSVQGTRGALIAKVERSEVHVDGVKGGFETSTGRTFKWDLNFSEFKEPYITTPDIAKKLGITNTLAKAAHPNIKISGSISIDGTKKTLESVPGIQYHTLGDGYKIPWEWFSAHTIQGYPNAYLDFGSKKAIGKATMEFFDGKKRLSVWNDNVIKKLRLAKQFEIKTSLTGLKFKVIFKELTMEGEISVPKEKILAVEYKGPLGNRFYCYNSELASCKLKVSMKDEKGEIKEEKEFTARNSVSFETIYDSPQQGLKYLPWDKEAI